MLLFLVRLQTSQYSNQGLQLCIIAWLGNVLGILRGHSSDCLGVGAYMRGRAVWLRLDALLMVEGDDATQNSDCLIQLLLLAWFGDV